MGRQVENPGWHAFSIGGVTMKIISVLLLCLVCQLVLAGEKTYGSLQIDGIVSNYDGDTFTVNIPQWPAIIGDKIEIRVAGIDTPEIHGHCANEIAMAKKAKGIAATFLKTGRPVVLGNMRRDKYFRIVADVSAEGVNLADVLIKAGVAVPYDGGTKKPWCPL